MPRKIEIKKPVYTMASVDGKNAELTMYGSIYEKRPRDPYTGKPREGNFILLSEFLEDLERIAGCRSLTVRMNSYGGDAGVSNTIHNRLRELSRNGVQTTCIVDGVAMSGGSLIMCGCNRVKANPSSLIMIHKAWTFLFGGYNADEMRKAAAENDAWDKMQVEIYHRKTGLGSEEILGMMAETTTMTGREAKEKGFVDELLEDAEPTKIAASADGRSLFVLGRELHLAPGTFAPDFIPTAGAEEAQGTGERIAAAPAEPRDDTTGGPEADSGSGRQGAVPTGCEVDAPHPSPAATPSPSGEGNGTPGAASPTGRLVSGATGRSFVGGTPGAASPTSGGSGTDTTKVNTAEAGADADETNTNQPGDPGSEGGKNTMTLDELRAQHPELVQQIEASAAQTERARLQGIDEVAAMLPAELVAEAKYGGKPCSAAELTLRAAQAAAKAGGRFLAGLNADAKDSGADEVAAAAAPAGYTAAEDGGSDEQRMTAGAAAAREFLGKEEK